VDTTETLSKPDDLPKRDSGVSIAPIWCVTYPYTDSRARQNEFLTAKRLSVCRARRSTIRSRITGYKPGSGKYQYISANRRCNGLPQIPNQTTGVRRKFGTYRAPQPLRLAASDVYLTNPRFPFLGKILSSACHARREIWSRSRLCI
jgi:hypothetical protein